MRAAATRHLELLLHKNAMPGFNDSGAHITNMAFFDANLASLKLAQQKDLATVATMVRRLTSEPAAFFAWMLARWRSARRRTLRLSIPRPWLPGSATAVGVLQHRDIFEHDQMLSRSDGVVSCVLINGVPVWRDDQFTPALGNERLGRALRAA